MRNYPVLPERINNTRVLRLTHFLECLVGRQNAIPIKIEAGVIFSEPVFQAGADHLAPTIPFSCTEFHREDLMISRDPNFLSLIMIWLLPHPLPPHPVSYPRPGRHQEDREREDQIRRRRESQVLYKSFNTLWVFRYSSVSIDSSSAGYMAQHRGGMFCHPVYVYIT
jgi:hypothetical protein